MNFEALKGLVNSITSSFKCSECNGGTNIKNVNINGIEGTSVILRVDCSSCGHKSLIKSEVVSVDLEKLNLPKDEILKIKKGLINKNNQKIGNLKKAISDNTIIDLNKNLKKENLNVSDFFS